MRRSIAEFCVRMSAGGVPRDVIRVLRMLGTTRGADGVGQVRNTSQSKRNWTHNAHSHSLDSIALHCTERTRTCSTHTHTHTHTHTTTGASRRTVKGGDVALQVHHRDSPVTRHHAPPQLVICTAYLTH